MKFYYHTVVDNDMSCERIHTGDVVMIDRSQDHPSDIVLIKVSNFDRPILREIRRHSNIYFLISSKGVEQQEISEVCILGRVVKHLISY